MPAAPSTRKTRAAPGPSPRIVSLGERASSTSRKHVAAVQRTAARKNGGKSTSASLAVAGKLPHSATLARARPEVFAFFAAAQNLVRLTPPWFHLAIVDGPPALSTGAVIDLKMSW